MNLQQKQREILLIMPPFLRLYKDTYSLDRYPLSLGYLAGTIKEETNWNVTVYNADFSPTSERILTSYRSGRGFENYLRNLENLSSPIWEEVKLTITEYQPAVIGIHCCTQNYVSASVTARLAKEINRRTSIIVGGPHPTIIGANILNNPNIDVVVKGEGEKTIVDLLGRIEKVESLKKVKGIIYKTDNKIIETPNRELIEDLDSLSYPHEYAPKILKDYDKYPLSAFQFIYATRGCPYNCFFCGSRYLWGRKVRFRSVENVVGEIMSLQRRGLRRIIFSDELFGGGNRKYITHLCNSLIRNCPGARWDCETHINLIDKQTIRLMKKAGCRSIAVGIESGNNEILRKMRKGFTIEEALNATNIIIKHGINLNAFFIVGFPEETEDTLNDTFTAIKKIKGRVIYSIFTPYPGTEAFDFCEKNGLIDNDYNIALYNHQSPENCFCINMQKERFRVIASKIERYVDRHNARQDLRDLFSFKILYKIKDLGIGRSLRQLENTIRASSSKS